MLIPSQEDISSLKLLCARYMPVVATAHEGRDIPLSLTEYQKLARTLPAFDGVWNLENLAAKDLLVLSHTFARWLKFGMSVFKPTEDLMSALMLTDPTTVDPEQVHPPFPTFIIQLPPKMFYSTGMDGEDEELKIAIVSHSATVPPATWPEAEKVSLEEALKLPHRHLISLTFCGPTVYLIDSLPVLGKEPMDMASWLNSSTPKELWMDVPQDDRDLNTRISFRKFYVNFCLYVSQKGKGKKEVKYTTKRAKKRKKKTPKMTPETWVIGRELKIDPELKQAAKDWLSGTGKGRYGWKIRKRSVTRGHWRNQACGPGRLERKKIWIEPFGRGPKAGDQIQHFYTTEGESEK